MQHKNVPVLLASCFKAVQGKQWSNDIRINANFAIKQVNSQTPVERCGCGCSCNSDGSSA